MGSFFAEFSWNQMFKATMVLFAIVDIVGSIPIIIKVKERSGGDIHAIKVSLVSLGIMLAFLFGGESILGIFGVGVKSFAVAGAIILFILAMEMILGIELFKDDGTSNGATIVPLAFPIIAGAGSMTSIISLQAEYDNINIAIAIIINILIVYLVLLLTKKIEKLLGPGGIAILQKVFGIILLAIAVKLFSANVTELL